MKKIEGERGEQMNYRIVKREPHYGYPESGRYELESRPWWSPFWNHVWSSSNKEYLEQLAKEIAAGLYKSRVEKQWSDKQ